MDLRVGEGEGDGFLWGNNYLFREHRDATGVSMFW
jgi:hypothetical protein